MNNYKRNNKTIMLTFIVLLFSMFFNIDNVRAGENAYGKTPPTWLDPRVYSSGEAYIENPGSSYKGVPYEIICTYKKYGNDASTYELHRKLEASVKTDGQVEFAIVDYYVKNESTKLTKIHHGNGFDSFSLRDNNGKKVGREETYEYYFMCPKAIRHEYGSPTKNIYFLNANIDNEGWLGIDSECAPNDTSNDCLPTFEGYNFVGIKVAENSGYINLLGDANSGCDFVYIADGEIKSEYHFQLRTFWESETFDTGQDRRIRMAVKSDHSGSKWQVSKVGSGSMETGNTFINEALRRGLLSGSCHDHTLAFAIYNPSGGLHFTQFVTIESLNGNPYPTESNTKLNAGKWEDVYVYQNAKIDDLIKDYNETNPGGSYDPGGEYIEEIDCGTLGVLLKYLDGAFTLIKIGTPVLVIILGVVDFLTALAASDEDAMKKNWSKFVKRLIIGACVFVMPFIVELLLEIAGFSGTTCGIR